MSCNKKIYEMGEPCRKSIGGIKRIVAVSKNEVEYIHYDEGNSDMINFILLKGDCHFSKINFFKDSASLTTTYTDDPTIGNGEYTSELVFKVSDFEYGLNTEFAENAPIVFVVQNYRDEYFLVGYENPAYLTNSVHTTGASLGDFSGEEMTFTCTSSKPLYKCVVGSEMADNIGTYPYISEKLLENQTSVSWSGIEVDSGDFDNSVNQDTVISDNDEEYFELEIEPHDSQYVRYGLKLQMYDSGLGYYWFMKGDNNITENIVRDTRDIASETEEIITVRKKIRQYLIGDSGGYLPSVKTNLCVVNYRDDSNFFNWDASGKISTYSQVLVFDIEIEYNTNGIYYFRMNKAQQIQGLG